MTSAQSKEYNQKQSLGFTLGDLKVSPDQNQVTWFNNNTKIQPKAMDVLAYLAQNHHRVVSTEELIENVWAGRVVTSSSVQKSINTLRNILLEFFAEQTVIENYAKKGYQLKITPQFLGNEQSFNQPSFLSKIVSSITIIPSFFWLVTLVIVVGGVIWFNNSQQLNISHKHVFSDYKSVFNESMNTRKALPHPILTSILYTQSEPTNADKHSVDTLLIKNETGPDWRIASTLGEWVHYAWSPDGQSLIAIEQQFTDASQVESGFYLEQNQLYTFHIFTLDLIKQELIEKQLLSQWYGQVKSVTWLDDQQVEFIASQGSNQSYRRFWYTPKAQELKVADNISFIDMPLRSVSNNRNLAIVGYKNEVLSLSIINQTNSLVASWPITNSQLDISWLPDDTGVISFDGKTNKIQAYYLNGETQKISLPGQTYTQSLYPQFSHDGSVLFGHQYTHTDQLQFESLSNSGDIHSYLTNKVLKNNPRVLFSPDGNKLIHNNGAELIVVIPNKASLIIETNSPTHINMPITHISWVSNSQFLYKQQGSIFSYDISAETKQLLINDASQLTPLTLSTRDNTLLVMKDVLGIKNLWLVYLDKNETRQLTFGSVGAHLMHKDNLYFQYIDQAGLWKLDWKRNEVKTVVMDFDKNVKLLFANEKGVYFVSGSRCEESDVMHHAFDSNSKSIYFTRSRSNINTITFHPNAGVLYDDCSAPSSNIIEFR